MKKIIFQFINYFNKYSLKFNLFFFVNFFILTLIANFSYFNNKEYITFVCLFILVFFLYFWIICILYSRDRPRNAILELIASRSKVKNLKKLIGAEVGVFKGSYSSQITNFFKSKDILTNLHLIDPWKINDEFKEYGNDKLEEAYLYVKNKFKNNKSIEIIRLSSAEASVKFDDNFFDFVYIDGNHEYKYVKQDLELWFPKLKKDGILFGDDYLRPYGVQKAVEEFTHEKKLIVHFTDNGNQFYFIKN